MTALLLVLWLLVGAYVYAFGNPKLAELGRLVFFAAAIALMFALSGRTVHLF
jgi:hypothetical protein